MIKRPPEYIKVNNKIYKINTDFKVALRCDEIAKDESISNIEKMMAIIYLLFGEEALDDSEHYDKFIELAIKYLNCGKNLENDDIDEIDMDLEQDYSLIKASFRTDYGIDIDNENLNWWDFYTYLNGLKDTSILNRVRNLRTFDTKDLKGKEKERIEKQKKLFALKERNPVQVTDKQRESAERFFKLTGIERRQK